MNVANGLISLSLLDGEIEDAGNINYRPVDPELVLRKTSRGHLARVMFCVCLKLSQRTESLGQKFDDFC
ncbi:MAG TPA: hypothetical protein V6D31_02850 [Candidatus Sericytochromatia bacterium]